MDSKDMTLFVNPMTCVAAGERGYNPNAVHRIVIKGEERFFEIEDQKMRMERMMAWKLLLWTIDDVDASVYKFMNVGDVHGLNNAITTYLSRDNRAEFVKEALEKELNHFTYKRGELFKTFTARYKELRREMDQVGYVVDGDILSTRMSSVLKNASKNIRTSYLNVITTSQDEQDEPIKILNAMQKQMNILEKHSHLRREEDESEMSSSTSSGSESDDEKKKRRRKRRGAARVLQAQKGLQGSDEFSNIRGVCLFFQEDRCFHKNDCKFEHRKLSKAEHTKLKEMISARKQNTSSASKSNIKCYACGQEGHISPFCPNRKESNNSTQAKVRIAHAEEKASMREMVSEMSSEDREKLMAELLNCEKEKEK